MGRGISERTRERLDAIREYAEENQPVTVRAAVVTTCSRAN